MAKVNIVIFFEEPFWVAVIERYEDSSLSVSRVVFGTEPKDYEVYNYLLKNYYKLKFSPYVKAVTKEKSRNPKRVRREINRQINKIGIGTKSQQALKLQQEKFKTKRKTEKSKKNEEKKQYCFELKQQKKKKKHKGR